MLNPVTHEDVVKKFKFQKELHDVLIKSEVFKELQETHPAVVTDMVIGFLENIKTNSRRDNGIVSFFVNHKEIDNMLEVADRKDEALYTNSVYWCNLHERMALNEKGCDPKLAGATGMCRVVDLTGIAKVEVEEDAYSARLKRDKEVIEKAVEKVFGPSPIKTECEHMDAAINSKR